MAVRYSFLRSLDPKVLFETHKQAFADYHVDMSYMTPERIKFRSIKSNVQYDLSVGAFDGDRLVGFTLIAIDLHAGRKSAFDAGTGIIPAYRGRGIAKAMFEHAIPKLKKSGVRRFLLEVLRPNQSAIRAYEKTGFETTRNLECFELGTVKSFQSAYPRDYPWRIKSITMETLQTFASEVDWIPSWENSFACMHRIPDDLIRMGAYDDDQCVGVIAFCPRLDWIMSLVVQKDFRRKGVGKSLIARLLKEICSQTQKVSVLNIDASDLNMQKLFTEMGFEFVIGQHEMEYGLS